MRRKRPRNNSGHCRRKRNSIASSCRPCCVRRKSARSGGEAVGSVPARGVEPGGNDRAGKKRRPKFGRPLPFSLVWSPYLEGHGVTGRIAAHGEHKLIGSSWQSFRTQVEDVGAAVEAEVAVGIGIATIED